MGNSKRVLVCSVLSVCLLGMAMPLYGEEPSAKPAGIDPICPDIEPTVSDDTEVWWGNRNRSYGPYLQFARADIPDILPEDEARPDFEPIYFELDRAELRPAAIETATRLYQFLMDNPHARVRLEGNCCDLYTWDYNIKLGQRRADAVKNFLVASGIDAYRIETVSFGKGRLVTTDPDKRPLNRRVDIIIASRGQ